eukprot:13595-Heterococcus_DN1.PRE.3
MSNRCQYVQESRISSGIIAICPLAMKIACSASVQVCMYSALLVRKACSSKQAIATQHTM